MGLPLLSCNGGKGAVSRSVHFFVTCAPLLPLSFQAPLRLVAACAALLLVGALASETQRITLNGKPSGGLLVLRFIVEESVVVPINSTMTTAASVGMGWCQPLVGGGVFSAA